MLYFLFPLSLINLATVLWICVALVEIGWKFDWLHIQFAVVIAIGSAFTALAWYFRDSEKRKIPVALIITPILITLLLFDTNGSDCLMESRDAFPSSCSILKTSIHEFIWKVFPAKEKDYANFVSRHNWY